MEREKGGKRALETRDTDLGRKRCTDKKWYLTLASLFRRGALPTIANISYDNFYMTSNFIVGVI